ncbi:MAG: radical SAM protein [Phycisphaerae bacterium]|nr:radical SAM protein [Phycisphaerae bacterium]
MSYVFGPVPSRRLGRSLGVDVVPFKTCTYDCIYCQLGRTTCRTIERKEWVPVEGVLKEVKSKLFKRPDYITLSGSGEPTLFSRLGDLIDGIQRMTNVPVALLTNGSLLWDTDVRADIQNVDLLIPSLDAGDEAMFRRVNRPHEAVSFDRLIDGLAAAREACRGQYWLEVFLTAGYTAADAEVKKLARYADLIKPDRIQLNTTTRPPAERFAEAVSRERLVELSRLFDPAAEVVADYHHVHEQARFAVSRDDILGLLRRRPCSIDGVAQGLSMHPNEVVKYVESLQAEGLVETTWTSGKRYYRITDRDG